MNWAGTVVPLDFPVALEYYLPVLADTGVLRMRHSQRVLPHLQEEPPLVIATNWYDAFLKPLKK